MANVIFVSDLALHQLGVKTEQYAAIGNLHHNKVIADGPFEGLNLRQRECGGEWICDEPKTSEQRQRFGKHLLKMNDGTLKIAGFI